MAINWPYCTKCINTIYRLTFAALYCSSFVVFFTSYAGANSLFDKQRVGDILEFMTPVYAYGMASMEGDYEGIIQLTKVMVASQILVEGFKALKLERRPNGSDLRSFPSGHSAAAFSAARYTYLRYGWKKAILPYSMAIITGWQRIAVSAHNPHDVLAGAVVAYIMNDLFVTPYLPKRFAIDARPGQIALSYHISF